MFWKNENVKLKKGGVFHFTGIVRSFFRKIRENGGGTDLAEPSGTWRQPVPPLPEFSVNGIKIRKYKNIKVRSISFSDRV